MLSSLLFGRRGLSGFSWSSTAEDVTAGVSAAGLTAIVTGRYLLFFSNNNGNISMTPTFSIEPRGVQRHRRRDGADTGGAWGARRHGRQEPPRRPGPARRRPRRGARGQARRHGARSLFHGIRPRLCLRVHRQGAHPQHTHVLPPRRLFAVPFQIPAFVQPGSQLVPLVLLLLLIFSTSKEGAAFQARRLLDCY
jgi:hypothetical protein